jgi:ribulose-5-phosphate 4-epimerase/fuculose-1-phosphate aldolase
MEIFMKDGVIKYSLEFIESEPIDFELCREIESVREILYDMNLIGVYSDGIGFGNISQIADSETRQFVITGTQTGDKARLEAKDYSLVTNIDIDTFKTIATGGTKPSSESVTHACIYELDSNIGAVIHIHSEPLWNFMLKGEYLATSDVEYGTIEMVRDVQKLYSKIDPLTNPLFVMKGHFEGIVAFGRTLKDAHSVINKLVGEYINKSIAL